MSDDQDEQNIPPPKAERANIALAVRCRACFYFKQAAYFKEPCHKLGIETYSKPCHAFTVNPKVINLQEKTQSRVARIVSELKNNELAALAALYNNEIKSRKFGFKLNQTVYVKVFGEDYLSNYAKAKVISANKEYVFIQSDNQAWYGQFMHRSVLTLEQFEKKRKSLQARKLIRDPNYSTYTQYKTGLRKNSKLDDYEAPNIDVFNVTYQPAKKSKVVRLTA